MNALLFLVLMFPGNGGYVDAKLPRHELFIAINDSVPSQQLKRNIEENWFDRYKNNRKKQGLAPLELNDENDRAVYHQIEELEFRRQRVHKRFKIVFVKEDRTQIDWFAPAFRVRSDYWTSIAPQMVEPLAHYDFLDWIFEDYWWYAYILPRWEKTCSTINGRWTFVDNMRREEFIYKLGEKYVAGYDYSGVWTSDYEKYVLLEELGYVSPDPPILPARPIKTACPIQISRPLAEQLEKIIQEEPDEELGEGVEND